MKQISIGILAGGKSSRMGTNKALIKLNNETIIGRLARELSCFGSPLISAAKKGLYEDLEGRIVIDENRDIGPIEGIRQIIKTADSEYVFICAADMPFITADLVRYMEKFTFSGQDAYVIRTKDRLHPLCAIYKRTVLPVIEELIRQGRYRLTEILDRVDTCYISLEYTIFGEKCVKNINTKDDLKQISKPFVFCVCGYSGSGKTWLIEKLINEFKKNGLSVSVLKHDGCDKYGDVPESDTDRYMKSGALSAAIFSDTRFSLHSSKAGSLDEMLGLSENLSGPPDYIIVEGAKESPLPSVEVTGPDKKRIPQKSSIICTVTAEISPFETDRPVFGRDDIEGIFDFIRGYFEYIFEGEI